jgi:hypothetical protein
MKLISTSWSCQRCGAAFSSTPPEHGLCDQCMAGPEDHVRQSPPQTATCPSCGGPVCPDCGDAMATVLVSIPASAPASVTEQATQLIAGYRAHRREVTGDDT